MVKRVFLVIFSGLVLFGAARLIAAEVKSPVTTVMAFSLRDSSLWVSDADVDPGDLDATHFYFHSKTDGGGLAQVSEKIDLNVIREDTDLSRELERVGQAALVKQILEGQGTANRLFGVGETELLDQTLKRGDRFDVLTLFSKQTLPAGPVRRIERYFIANGQTLQAELRWYESADANEIERAKAEFESALLKVGD